MANDQRRQHERALGGSEGRGALVRCVAAVVGTQAGRQAQGDAAGGGRRVVPDRPRRNPRAGRRIRLREIHTGPHAGAPACPGVRPDPAARRRHRPVGPAPPGGLPPERADDLPGSLCVVEPAPYGQRHPRGRLAHPPGEGPRGTPPAHRPDPGRGGPAARGAGALSQ
ncbi:hypothetical protein G6F68_010118 [Rhizopus microsporus]|nr:hypothetical protein G6F68_010118 [Rhizopus microsporus]